MIDLPVATAILVGGLMLLLAVGIPVAFAFLCINLVGAAIFLGGEPGLDQLVRNSVSSVMSFSLAPIVFFVLMGEVLFHTGVALRSIDAVDRLIRRVPGRLSVVAIVGGTVFSAISGSTIATTAMLGSLLLPRMLARGYEKKIAMGPIMAIGAVDVLIPPSALTVLLGSLAGISITKLLFASIVPGLIMAGIFLSYVIARCYWNPSLAPVEADCDDEPGLSVWKPVLIYVVPLVLIFVVVVGSMTGGWATPTEAAAIGAAASIAASALYGMLTVQALRKALLETVAISAMVLFIILASTTFAQILNFSGVTSAFVTMILDQQLTPMTFVLWMVLILVVMGFFLDQVSIMMITLPFLMPIVSVMGIDPIWLGIIFLISMQLGLLHPPFGLLLFTMKGVAPPEIGMGQICLAALPFVMLAMVVLVLVIMVPQVATWLPEAMLTR